MTERDPGAPIGSFVALGDSFTEGLYDPYPGGGYRGWADRVAEVLAAQAAGFGYANLAISGKLLGQVIAEQVPRATEMAPDLVSLAAGGNDILRGADVDALASRFEHAVVTLQAAGCQVLIFTGFDPRMFPVIRLLRGRVATYDMHLRAIADHHDCDLVDLWSMRALQDPRAWSPDRLHLSSEGHRRVAHRTCEVLGVPSSADPAAWPGTAEEGDGGDGVAVDGVVVDGVAVDGLMSLPASSRSNPAGRAVWLAARRQDARWARRYAMPWVRRRLARADSDRLDSKRPDLLPVDPGSLIG
jgi:lysophospholipase L1-like esterase